MKVRFMYASGRKPVVTSDKLKRARALLASGLTVREAAGRLKVGKTALYEALAEGTSREPIDVKDRRTL